MIALDAAEGYAKHLALGLCHDHQVRLLSEPGGVVVEKAPAMAVRQAKRVLRKANRCPQFLQRTDGTHLHLLQRAVFACLVSLHQVHQALHLCMLLDLSITSRTACIMAMIRAWPSH